MQYRRQLGRLLTHAQEQLLEDFYAHLGAKPLTSLVKVDHIHSGALQRTSSQSQVLRQHVLERLTIFLAETRRRSAEYSAEWLMKEGNFVIEEVRDLKARFTLKYGTRAQSHLEVGPRLILPVGVLLTSARSCTLQPPNDRGRSS